MREETLLCGWGICPGTIEHPFSLLAIRIGVVIAIGVDGQLTADL
jgi:hypothetical protein